MSKEKVKTIPNLANISPQHLEAIANGNDHFGSWQYNVQDHLKGKTTEEIRQHLKDTAFPFAVCMENWISDYNQSSLFRNANGFNAKEIFYIGNKKYDKRGCQGVHNYSDVTFLSSIEDLIKLKEKYVFVAVDNVVGATALSSYNPVPNTLFIFGSEGTGLTDSILKLCDQLIYIQQYGSVRSLNAAVASGIIMNDFIEKFKKIINT